ncbi:restriction endonuclease subunit S [Pedobacter sp.]
MSKNKKLIPELRFPEFEKKGEWEYVNGNKLFEPISNKNHNSDLPILAITQEQGAVPRDMINYRVSVAEKSVESYKVVEIGDFIISLRSFQGGIEYSNFKGLCSPAYIILRKKVDLENDYYRHYFKSVPFIRDLNRNLEGIRDGKMVSYQQFSEILIPKPTNEEQQKIASCLLSLDEVIEAHSQKLELLKNHKKGLVQNLFPQEGEKVPKYRFKDFENDGEWVEKILGDVAEFSKGKGISKSDVIENGKIPCIRYGQLYTHYKETINDVISYTNVPVKDLVLSQVNDVIIPSSGETQEDIATASCVMKGGIALGGDLNIIRSDINGVFLSYYLNNAKKKDIAQMAQGISVVHLYSSQLQNLKILIPSKSEQQKIASCLSALDVLITAQAEKIEQLKQHKKGLMQGLFPKSITNYELRNN